jgi:hypothetical protein
MKEVVRIDTLREFAVFAQPPMLTPRRAHACVYHAQFLYVIGGAADEYLQECERYVCAENRWEALPPLPRASSRLSGVVLEGSLYALGGSYEKGALDLVQRLRLSDLSWECMDLRLPQADFNIPCFKDTQVYLVIKKTLYLFTGLEVVPVKTLQYDIENWYGPSYYCRGSLYCSYYDGAANRLEIGSLASTL